MYNDTIKAENKIISSDDLTQIFQLMGETLKKYLKTSYIQILIFHFLLHLLHTF